MKPFIEIINQLNILEDKLNSSDESERNFNRIKQALLTMGYTYSSPINESYNDTRTDVEATIIGDNIHRLVITKVIKPIITKDSIIIQKGIVIVESK